MVTMTTLIGVTSAGEVRFGIVKRLDGYGCHTVFIGEAFGVAARLAANEEWNFAKLFLRVRRPDDGDVGHHGGSCDGCGLRLIRRRGVPRTQMRRHSAIGEFKIILEHR